MKNISNFSVDLPNRIDSAILLPQCGNQEEVPNSKENFVLDFLWLKIVK